MAGQANGQFDSSRLLATCQILTTAQLNNPTQVNLSVLLAPFSFGSKKGLLGNYNRSPTDTTTYMTGVDTTAYMTFDQLNNPTARSTWLEARYNKLLTESVIPVHPSLNTVGNSLYSGPNDLEPISGYNTKVVEFLELIGKEFCYYQNNYFNAVNFYLIFYSTASTEGAGAPNLNDWQNASLVLNQKVNTMISLINFMASKNVANMRTLQNQLVSQTTSITSSTESLRVQADILRDNNKTNTLYKQMVESTEEKNRANKNLLAVYFTLNVVAITCLFIAARTL